MLHAGWQNDDIAGGVFFRSFLRVAHTTSFKNHNHFFSLVKMPRKSDPWAENVFMNVRLRTELFVRNEIANPCLWATRDFASYALDGEEKTAKAAGCDDYVPKPFSPRELLAKIRRHLS